VESWGLIPHAFVARETAARLMGPPEHGLAGRDSAVAPYPYRNAVISASTSVRSDLSCGVTGGIARLTFNS
jgi:hypothetical protein